jgi:hypothetical protein
MAIPDQGGIVSTPLQVSRTVPSSSQARRTPRNKGKALQRRREGDLTLRLRAVADRSMQNASGAFCVKARCRERRRRLALSVLDQRDQQVLGSEVVVAELASDSQGPVESGLRRCVEPLEHIVILASAPWLCSLPATAGHRRFVSGLPHPAFSSRQNSRWPTRSIENSGLPVCPSAATTPLPKMTSEIKTSSIAS